MPHFEHSEPEYQQEFLSAFLYLKSIYPSAGIRLSQLGLSKLLDEMLNRPSAIRSMMKLADDRNVRSMGLDPKDVISFGGGWVGHHAPERLREIYVDICSDKELFHRTGGYPPIPGTPECRRELAHMDEHLFGVKATGENIHVGISSTELTHDLLRVIVNPGEDVVLFDPTYVNYYGQLVFALTSWHLSKVSGGVDRLVPNAEVAYLRTLDPATWSYLPDVDRSISELEQIFKIHKPRALMLATPDNPTGQVVPQKFMQAALEICQRNNAYMIVDYAYKWQCFLDPPPEYFSWSPAEIDNLILIYSASKWSRALGRRLGWVTASKKMVEAMETMLTYSILCADHMHELATAKYLEESIADGGLRRYVNYWNAAYKEAARITLDGIDKYCGCRRLEPQGALYTVMDLGVVAEPMVHEILRNTGVLFIPGAGFGESLVNGVRVSYGPLVETPERIKVGMERVGEYLKTCKTE